MALGTITFVFLILFHSSKYILEFLYMWQAATVYNPCLFAWFIGEERNAFYLFCSSFNII